MTNVRHRVLAFLCALTLLVCTSGSLLPSAPVAAAPTIDDLEAQLKDLQSQEKEIKNELASASSDLSSSKKRKQLLESQIDNAEKQIALLQQRIAATEAELADKEAEIAEAEDTILDLDISIAYTHERLGERLRAIAKTGNMSAIQRLLNTDNYEEYLLKSKAAECIAKQDQALMDKLEAAQEEVRNVRHDFGVGLERALVAEHLDEAAVRVIGTDLAVMHYSKVQQSERMRAAPPAGGVGRITSV